MTAETRVQIAKINITVYRKNNFNPRTELLFSERENRNCAIQSGGFQIKS